MAFDVQYKQANINIGTADCSVRSTRWSCHCLQCYFLWCFEPVEKRLKIIAVHYENYIIKTVFIKFYMASLVVVLCYGIAAGHYGFFPAPQLQDTLRQARLAIGILPEQKEWYFLESNVKDKVTLFKHDEVFDGLTVITTIGQNRTLVVKIIDLQGEEVYKWEIEWDTIWPDANHVPLEKLPKRKPGTHIHGSKMLDNGDIIFNFENLGLVKLDACGSTKWRLPEPTHHSINLDEKGNIWLPGQNNHEIKWNDFPSFEPPFKDDVIMEVSSAGVIISQQSVMELLRFNGLDGLMFMSTLSSRNPRPTGDLFHMNDVEVFPQSLPEGKFKHGDVMISLRNINTVLVYNPKTRKIKFTATGQFLRQHDPDFIDGNTISVYDNNHLPGMPLNKSKIVFISAISNQITTVFEGSHKVPFYSKIMGKHQWLPNGNLLILESMNGRVIELSPDMELVWEYHNLHSNGEDKAIMEGADRLDERYDHAFFEGLKKSCAVAN